MRPRNSSAEDDARDITTHRQRARFNEAAEFFRGRHESTRVETAQAERASMRPRNSSAEDLVYIDRELRRRAASIEAAEFFRGRQWPSGRSGADARASMRPRNSSAEDTWSNCCKDVLVRH